MSAGAPRRCDVEPGGCCATVEPVALGRGGLGRGRVSAVSLRHCAEMRWRVREAPRARALGRSEPIRLYDGRAGGGLPAGGSRMKRKRTARSDAGSGHERGGGHARGSRISATHRNLKERVAEGSFREDLFDRISVFPILLPPLRERLDDLPHLVDALLARMSVARGNRLSEAGLARLAQHDFPGNVRELRNVLERVALMAVGRWIEPEHFGLAGDIGQEP